MTDRTGPTATPSRSGTVTGDSLYFPRRGAKSGGQPLVQIVTNDFKTELREANHWLLFAPIPVRAVAAKTCLVTKCLQCVTPSRTWDCHRAPRAPKIDCHHILFSSYAGVTKARGTHPSRTSAKLGRPFLAPPRNNVTSKRFYGPKVSRT